MPRRKNTLVLGLAEGNSNPTNWIHTNNSFTTYYFLYKKEKSVHLIKI